MNLVIVERIQGHYDIEEVEFGKVYRWCPESVVVECGCGETTSLTVSTAAFSTCRRCGTDLAVVPEVPNRERLGDETTHPWRYDAQREGFGLPC